MAEHAKSAGNALYVIVSSGYTFAFQEAQMMKDLAVVHGVPASAILLETKAANTFENVIFVRDILRQKGWRQILLVSSPYHMRRAVWTFRRAAPEITVIPSPISISQSQFYHHGHGASLEQIRGILHEYLGLAYYRWKGWL